MRAIAQRVVTVTGGPYTEAIGQHATITGYDSGHYEARWIDQRTTPASTVTLWLYDGEFEDAVGGWPR